MFMDIIILVIIAVCVFFGYKRGFVRSLCNMLSTVLSIVVASLTYGRITEFISSSPVGEFVSEKLSENIGSSAIDFSSVPKVLRGTLQQGIAEATDTVAHNLAVVIIGVISIVVTIVVVRLLLNFLFKVLDLFAKLPVIKQCNKLLGVVFGAVSGYFWVCIVAFAITQIGLISDLGVVKTLTDGSTLIPIVSGINFLVMFLS